MIAGILDLRVTGDAYLSLEEDREKALALAAVSGGFEDLLRAYWKRTPEVPTPIASRYMRIAIDGPRRAGVHVRRLGLSGGTVLDVGCGTGGMLIAAAAVGAKPVGVDIALRWLVVASRALSERGVHAELVAADGALLPFRPGTFDAVTCVETIEHASDAPGLLHSCLSRTRPGGVTYLVTANRYSIAAEPTVGLWGVGWLPRRLAVRYVAHRRHTRYAHFRPTSVGRLRTLLGPNTSATIGPAVLPPPPTGSSRSLEIGIRAYHLAREHGPAKLLRWVAPYIEIISR